MKLLVATALLDLCLCLCFSDLPLLFLDFVLHFLEDGPSSEQPLSVGH